MVFTFPFFQLATGILSDVKTALQDFDRNGENQAFWGLVENALSKYSFKNHKKLHKSNIYHSL